MSLDLHTVKYEPLDGSSYIPLPSFLAAKKAIVNLKNDDDDCVKRAITRALNPVEKNSERIDQNLREKSEVLNWEGLKFAFRIFFFNLNFITYIPPVKPEVQAQGCILRRSMVINPLSNDSPVRM